MKKLIPLLISIALLSGCSTASKPVEGTSIVTTTYPVYLLARTLTAGIDDVTVSRLSTGEVSCLHDYTLSVTDMKLIEGADIIALSGGGMEGFMDDALAKTNAKTIDCDANIDLFPMTDGHTHEDHDHEVAHEESDDHDHDEDGHDHGDFDPHFWMDPDNYAEMLATMSVALCEAMPSHAETIAANLQQPMLDLTAFRSEGIAMLEDISSRDFITFHDGFHYFAHTFNLNPLAAIEEEAGSEASAQDIAEIVHLVEEHHIPAIFTETYGSDATALAISRETGCAVHPLSLLMSGDAPADNATAAEIMNDYYLDAMRQNLSTIQEAMK